MAESTVRLGDAELVLDASGAVWLPARRTLVVADLHLEKSSSFARRGMLLPPYDSTATLGLLWEVVARRDPATVICLGDSFHDRGGFARLTEGSRLRLSVIQAGRDWLWVTGNHDPDLPPEIVGDVASEIALDGLTFRHEPRAATSTGADLSEVAGHLHPAAKVRGHGRSVRRRAFALDGSRMVLPAFGVLAGGLNVLDRAFAPLFGAGARAVLIGGGRLFPVPFTALVPD